MLVTRIVTALVLLPIVLAAIWFAPTPWLYALFSAAALLIAYEWSALAGLSSQFARGGYVLVCGAALAAAWLAVGRQAWTLGLLGLSVLWWLGVAAMLPGFPENIGNIGNFGRRPGRGPLAALGLLLIVPTIVALATLHGMPGGSKRVIFAFALVWIADTGAYFSGRTLGRHKLAPRVSPGKTREGAAGGLIACLVWAAATGHYVFGASGRSLAAVTALSLAAAALSIVGDLGISMFKRLAGVKDSGALLPGHGGMLDRVDSLLAAAPVLTLGLMVLHL